MSHSSGVTAAFPRQCAVSINADLRGLVPPVPPSKENGRFGTTVDRKRGPAIAFHDAGSRAHREKPVDGCLCNLVPPRGCKRKPPTSNFGIPRVGAFCPRVGLFLPRVDFCSFAARPLSLSLFSLEKEEERGAGGAKGPIHEFWSCLKNRPRVCYRFSSYSVDSEFQNVQCWRALAMGQGSIHASTGRNACVPLEAVRNE